MYMSYSNPSLANRAGKSHQHRATIARRRLTLRFLAILFAALAIVSIVTMVQAQAESNKSSIITVPSSPTYEQDGNANVSHKVTVEQGDSLWSIATQYAPEGTSIRHYIDEMKRANHLTSSSLRQGQVLQLP